MKLCRAVAAVALIATGALALHTALAEEAAITRTDLQQEDLSIPGRAVVQVLVEFAPGASFRCMRIRARRSSMSPRARWNTRSRGRNR